MLRRDPRDLLAVLVPGILATLFCLVLLRRIALSEDEYATVAIAAEHGSLFWHGIARDGGNMAGYYLVLHGLVALFGAGVWLVRSP
jgi:hypothetical protein